MSSEQLRKEGNELYANVMDGNGFGLSVKLSKLERACQCYMRAVGAACTTKEKSSAHKNYGAAARLLVLLTPEDDMKKKIYWLQECIGGFSTAHSLGGISQTEDWCVNVLDTHHDFCAESLSYVLAMADWQKLFFKVFPKINYDTIKGSWQLALANKYFHLAVKAIEENNYKTALHFLHECYTPLEIAGNLDGYACGDEVQTDVRILKEDVHLQMCQAKSLQAVATGDGLLDYAMKEEEELNQDMMWEVVDWYKEALTQSETINVECEAVACSKLANVFYRVLKLRRYSLQFSNRAIDLASTLLPKVCDEEEWFKVAVEIKEKYAVEDARNSTEYQAEKKSEILARNKESVEKLAEAKAHLSRDKAQFLRVLYEKLPPKGIKYNVDDLVDLCKEANYKKAFQSSIFHYHPDKQKGEGEDWVAIAEEITKVLLSVYSMYSKKGCD